MFSPQFRACRGQCALNDHLFIGAATKRPTGHRPEPGLATYVFANHADDTENAMSSRQHEKNIETGQQGTHEPWKKPGQASQDTSPKVPKKEDRQGDFDQVNQTS